VFDLDDNKIIDLYFERKESAIDETRRKYGQRLYRSAMNILHNSQDAEECVNDALYKAWEAIPPNCPAMLGAFLAKIARNLSINKWKARNAARRGGGEADILLSELEEYIPASQSSGTEPEEAYEANLLTHAINDFLNSIEQEVRVAFVLRYFHGESIRSICERFNMSESKVKSMLFRTRKKLGAYLVSYGYEVIL